MSDQPIHEEHERRINDHEVRLRVVEADQAAVRAGLSIMKYLLPIVISVGMTVMVMLLRGG